MPDAPTEELLPPVGAVTSGIDEDADEAPRSRGQRRADACQLLCGRIYSHRIASYRVCDPCFTIIHQIRMEAGIDMAPATMYCPSGKVMTYGGKGRHPTRCDECKAAGVEACEGRSAQQAASRKATAVTRIAAEPEEVDYEVEEQEDTEPTFDAETQWLAVVQDHDFLTGSAIAQLLDVPTAETPEDKLEKLEAAQAFLTRAIARARALV